MMAQILKFNSIIMLLLIFRLAQAQLPDIVAMEYYYDNDPSYGNGISVPITQDSLIDINFDADLSTISGGFHILYIRVKDESGKWSMVHTEGFQKPYTPPAPAIPEALPKITEMEYYFDADPGFGNGTEITIAADSLINVDFDIDLSGLPGGVHILFVRVKDELDSWTIVHTHSFEKSPDPITPAAPETLPKIVAMEYFFDTDPGFENGTEVTIAADSLINVDFDIDLSGLPGGVHILFVRLKDESGNWSIGFTNGFLKFPEPIAVANPEALTQIVEMEYFFDADPGFGNGQPVPIASDSLIEVAFEADFSLLDNGTHNFYLRVKDENGAWTLLYSDPFFKFNPPAAGISELLPDIVFMEYFFDNDPGYGNGTEILNIPDSVIMEEFIADIATLGGGTHLLYTRVKDENNQWSLTATTPFCLQGIHLQLEGPYNSNTGLMSTALNDAGLLPLSQPFGTNPGAVWYYDGTETVPSIPNANVVDWLLLQSRDAIDPESATSLAINESQVAFLLNNGKIVGLDGETNISFSEPIENELYLVVFQRNHLGIMSSYPLDTIGDCSCSYNFTIRPDQVYGAANGHKEINTNVWGMITGDTDANGLIDTNDKVNVWQPESGNAGYKPGDLNMNGQVDNIDKNEQWIPNNGSIGQVPD